MIEDMIRLTGIELGRRRLRRRPQPHTTNRRSIRVQFQRGVSVAVDRTSEFRALRTGQAVPIPARGGIYHPGAARQIGVSFGGSAVVC